jgi:pyruvate dehydrogenase E2 component (dihydrolipoamide acetyltransferase)
MGQSMEEGRVVNWLKSVDSKVERGEVIAEIETDKATIELEALESGTLVEIVVPAGEVVPIGTVIAAIEDDRPEPELSAPSTESKRIKASPAAKHLAAKRGVDLSQVRASAPNRFITKADVEGYLVERQAKQANDKPVRLDSSPVARRLAQEHGIDLTQIQGTGPAGRVVKADVEAWLAAQEAAEPKPGRVEAVRRVPLARIKQATARRMSESKATIPHFYATTDVEMSRALALRESLQSRGLEISINDLVLRATALALVQHPNLNATFAGDELHIYPEINLAVAVALEEGLITPVIHNCESLSLSEVAAAARTIIERARTGRLRQTDMERGTFTVSNLGMFDVTHFQAIVNPPQAAILAVGRLHRVPVFGSGDRVVPAQLMTASVSADHRVTDGVEVARFLQELKRVLEDAFEIL